MKKNNPFLKSGFLGFVFLLLFFSLHAQYKDYARHHIKNLCAPALHGRGYVNKGCNKAANYLESEFIKLELLSFGKSYKQQFTLNTNTFPGKMQLRLDGKNKKPGKNFYISSASPGIKGKFEVLELFVALDSVKEIMNSKGIDFFKKKFIASNKKEIAALFRYNPEVAGVIEITPKFTWHVADGSEMHGRPYLVFDSALYKKGAKQIQLNIQSKFEENYPVANVIGYLKGRQYPDSFLVITAHYDHLGRMGKKTYFPGANDNASGVALMLSIADYFSKHPDSLKYSIAFMAFAGEEMGLLGAFHYINDPLFPLGKIKFLINLDICGTGDDGIMVVNATVNPKEFELLQNINQQNQLMPKIGRRGAAAISDHHPFHLRKVKCFYIYTLGGIAHYHNIHDKAKTLPLTKFDELHKLLTQFLIKF